MSKRNFVARLGVIACVVIATAPARAATTVYNNVATPANAMNVLLPANQANSPEHANQIALASYERMVSSITIRMRIQGAGVATCLMRVRFYKNDGAGSAPGTTIWDSGPIPKIIDSGAGLPYFFTVPAVRVPANFTYSIQITDRQGQNQSAMGPELYGPPTIGSAPLGYWRNTSLNIPDWAFIANNDQPFGATVSAEIIPGDVNHDGFVDVVDLLAVIGQWGPCPAPPAACPADVAPVGTPNGVVNVDDLLIVIANWG